MCYLGKNRSFLSNFCTQKFVGVRGQYPCDTQQKHYINRLRLIVVSILSHVSARAQHSAPRKSEQVSTVKNHPLDNF